MRKFRLPLPERVYSGLREEAERMGVPATALAREAVEWWLRQRFREARHEAIVAYAAEMAGSHLDLDTGLESAGIEYVVNAGKAGI